jgi:hypothetical protein
MESARGAMMKKTLPCEETVIDRSPFPHKLGREKRPCSRAATMCVASASSPGVRQWLCGPHAKAKLAKRNLLDQPIWRPC